MLESVLLGSSSVSASKQFSSGNNTQQQQVAINNSTHITTTNNTYSGTPDTPVIANVTNQYSSMINHSFTKYHSHLPPNMESTSQKESTDTARADSRIPAVKKEENPKLHSIDNKKKSDKLNKKSSSAIPKFGTPTNTSDSKRKAEKPNKKALKLGNNHKNELSSDNEGVTGCTLMSPDNAPSMGCFGCISRKGKYTFAFLKGRLNSRERQAPL